MATRVEINSTLASLVPDVRSEAKPQRVYVSVLSDAGPRAKEASASLTLEEKAKLGGSLRSATMGPRPRLFPKPFSKEKCSESFANVKPPVPALRSSSLLRKGPEETSSAKASSANVPPLVDQKVLEGESKAGAEVVTNVAFYSGASTNTVILFEAAGPEQTKVSLAQDKRAAEDRRVVTALPAKELQGTAKQLEKPPQPPETPRNPEGSLHRQISLSSSLRPVTWNSLKTGEKKDTCEAPPGEKTHDDANAVHSKVDFSVDVHQRPKHRPVSAIFLESLRDQKHRPVEASEEKSPEEKSWARKPRPLSMDLTAKFEQKDSSSGKKTCSPQEGKESVSVVSFTDLLCHQQSEMGPKTEESEIAKGSSSKANLKSSSQDLGILNNGKYLWEAKLKSKSEQMEAKPEITTAVHGSERSPESTVESRMNKGGKRPDEKETFVFLGSESPAAPSEQENRVVRGSVKKHISLFASDNPSTSVDPELLPAAAEKESSCVSIQQRIKELTTDPGEARLGNLRRPLQSRPLSADLTKMFSSPTLSGEVKPEKPAENRNESLHEMQENLKSKDSQLVHSPDSPEAQAAGNAWKTRQVLKLTTKPDQLERKGNLLGEGQQISQPSENPISFTSNLERKLKAAAPPEKSYVKTVRATMFDHNVQRHHVTADHPGLDSVLKISEEGEAKPEVGALGHSRRSWLGEAEETAAGVKKEHHKQPDSSQHAAEVEESGKAACSSEDKKTTLGIHLEKYLVEKSEKPVPKNTEESVSYQRVEPRYEIFQACGERAVSEAITMAPEKKAMTLRTRKSSVRENKRDEDVLHSAQTGRVSSKTFYLKEDNVISQAGDAKVFPSKSVLRGHTDFFSSECTSAEQKKDSDKAESELSIAEKVPYSANRSKCLGVNEKGNKLHSEIKTDQGEVCSGDKPERSSTVKCSSEKRSFRPGGTDSSEFKANLDWEVISTGVSKHGAQSSSVLSSGQVGKPPSSHHPDTKVLTTSKEESRPFGLRKSLDFNCREQDFSLARTARENSEKTRVIDPEEKVRRTKSSVSDLKISERWRRRTLPQDSIKTEEVVWLSPENIRRLSRTDSLQLDEGLIKKRSKKSPEGQERNGTNQAVLSSQEECLKNQSSAFETKATYFAVTYQVPGTKKEQSCVGSPSASEAHTVLSSNEGATINLDPFFPGRSKPSLQQPNKISTSTNSREEPREVHVSGEWARCDQDGAFSKNTAFGTSHLSGKDTQQCHERGLDHHSQEKFIDVDSFLAKRDRENAAQADLGSGRRKVSSSQEPRSPLRHAQLGRDGELVSPKRSETSFDPPGRKAEDGYRSQILDIDALMAEYKEESTKASGVRDKLSEEHGSFSREKSKSKRSVSDKTTSSYSWREWKGLDPCSVDNKQSDCAGESHRPEKLMVNEKSKEKLDSCSPDFDKQKPKDKKLSPPYWGNPSCFFSEKLVNSPVEFPRKKTFIVDEDEELNLTSRNPSPKFVTDKVQPVTAAATDQRWEVSFASRLSIKADDGLFQKKLVVKERFLEASPAGDWGKGAAAKGGETRDSDPARPRGDWRSCAPGLGAAATDLRRSYSEKIRQARDALPLLQEPRARREPPRCRQGSEGTEGGWKHKMPPQVEFFFQEDKKAPRKEWPKQSSARVDGSASSQRSCRGLARDRRAGDGLDQLKQCFSRQPPGAKDTDTLVQEPDGHYGTWNQQRHSGDSFAPESPSPENDVISTRKQPPGSLPSSLSSQTEPASLPDHHDFSKDQRSTSLDRSSTDMDSTDGTDLPPLGDTGPEEKAADFSFIDQTTVLDSSALKTRVQLSKKRRRRVPVAHSLRRSRGLELENRFSLTEEPDNTWMFKDSTEEKKTMQQEDSDEEDKAQRGVRTSAPSQRLPVFPGMDHSVLKAQLRRRQESESPGEQSSAQLFRSPKAQLQLGAAGSRVLPSSVEKEERSEEKSPQWLKELKSKKRQSHYENQV